MSLLRAIARPAAAPRARAFSTLTLEEMAKLVAAREPNHPPAVSLVPIDPSVVKFKEQNVEILKRSKDFPNLLLHMSAGSFNDVNYATAFSQLAKLRGKQLAALHRDSNFHKLICVVGWKMKENKLKDFGSTRNISSIVHSLARLKVPNTAITTAISDDAQWLVANGNAIDVGNTAWAFAMLRVKSPEPLFAAIELHADEIVTTGSTQAVANTAWAAASLNVSAPALFESIEKHSTMIVKQCKMPQDLARLAWAAATLAHSAPTLFNEIGNRGDFIGNGYPKSIADAAWAFATANVMAPKLFKVVETRMTVGGDGLRDWPHARDIVKMAWAVGKLGCEAPKFLAAVDNESEILILRGGDQGIATVAVAFARSGCEPASFFNLLERRGEKFVSGASERQIVDVTWALVLCGGGRVRTCAHEALLRALLGRVVEADASRFVNESLEQLVEIRASGVELGPLAEDLEKRISKIKVPA